MDKEAASMDKDFKVNHIVFTPATIKPIVIPGAPVVNNSPKVAANPTEMEKY